MTKPYMLMEKNVIKILTKIFIGAMFVVTGTTVLSKAGEDARKLNQSKDKPPNA